MSVTFLLLRISPFLILSGREWFPHLGVITPAVVMTPAPYPVERLCFFLHFELDVYRVTTTSCAFEIQRLLREIKKAEALYIICRHTFSAYLYRVVQRPKITTVRPNILLFMHLNVTLKQVQIDGVDSGY